MDKRLLEILCCPVTKTPLRLLSEGELAALNDAIATLRVLNGAGANVVTGLAAGLITRDGKSIYRIDDDIPVMLADEAIAVAQMTDFAGAR
ncbi:MAG: Trm112 family protein [Dokdonella sp.]